MKIVCDACQAKYSISDDKVQGKVFKIRCKKCSNIIVVRGGAEASPAPAPQQEKDTRVYDYGYEGGEHAHAGDESVWHVVINQDQVGPMTAADVRARSAAGEIDGETYGWREGFADWLPLGQIDVFAELVASGSTTAAAPAKSGGRDAVSALFGGANSTDESGTMRSDPGDLFASASGGGRAQAAASSSADDEGDLFGSKPAASKGGGGGDAKLRGERNENSVLFSLNNLAQLASDKPAPVMSAPSSGHASGAAGGEGSGLIDIRSMASAYLGGGAATAKSMGTNSSIGSIDDLPVFGGGGFSEPAVIVPTSRGQNNNKFMFALIGGVGLLAVAAIIMVVVMMKGKDNNKSDTVAVNDKPVVNGGGGGSDTAGGGTPDPNKPATPPPATGSDTKPATGSDTAAKPPDTTPPPTTTPPTTPDKKPATTPPPVTHNKPATTPVGGQVPVAHKDPTPAVHKDPTPATTPDKKPAVADAGGCDEVSCVLNNYEGACCAKFKKGGPGPTAKKPVTGGDPPPTTKPASDLPDALDRGMISSGVDKVKARVMSCGDKSSAKGQVKVSVKVGADGHVSGVTVKATPDPALGNCVQAAMQKATFAKTQNGGSFGYPFVF